MMNCSSRRSFWTALFVGLLFAAFIGGTQVPIQFSIGKRAEYVPLTLVPESKIAPAGYNFPEVPTSVAFNDVTIPPVVSAPVESPITEPPPLNTSPVSLPPVQEPSVPNMPPVVTPIAIPPSMEIPAPKPAMASPPLAMAKVNDPQVSPPPVAVSSEPSNLKGKQLEEYCSAQSINSNLDFLKCVVAQTTAAEKELAENSTILKQRLSQATDELNTQDAAPGKKVITEYPAETIDCLLVRVKVLRAKKATLEGQTVTIKCVIRNQFDEIEKQVKEQLGIQKLNDQDVQIFLQQLRLPG